MPKTSRVSETAYRLEQHLRRSALLPEGSRIVVAVSGGPDSVALLSLLSELRLRMKYRLWAVYVNHGWRPRAARAEEIFVRKLGQRFSVPVEIVRVKPQKRPRHSWEGTAREDRYAALTRCADKHRARFVALAHTLEDQAETVLLALFRGAGLQGAAAMAPRRPSGMGRLQLVRPLLGFSHDALTHYLRQRKIAWRLDRSNEDERLRRNWVRRRLMPKICNEFGPHVPERLAAFAALAREEEDGLACLTERWCKLHVRAVSGRTSVQRATLLAEPLGFRRRIVRWMIRAACGSLIQMTTQHTDSVLSLLDSSRAQLSLPQHLIARTVSGRLRIARR